MFHLKWLPIAACLVLTASGQSAASPYDDCRDGNAFTDSENQFIACDHALQAALDTKQKSFLYFKRAEALYWMDKFGPALADVDLAIQGNRQLVPAYVRRAWIYLTFGQWEEASRDIEEVLAQEPHNAEGLFALSYLFTSIEPNSARALEALRQSLEIKPDFHLARLNLAYKNYMRGDLEGMLKEFDTILAHDAGELDKVSFRSGGPRRGTYPFSGYVRYERSKYLIFARRNEEALEGVNWLIAHYPNVASAFVLRGQILRGQNKESDALKEYSHAVELDPADVDARRGKAWTLFSLEKMGEAMAEADWLAQRTSPVRGEGFQLRAYINKKLGLGDQALLDYEEAFRNDREILRRTQRLVVELGYASADSSGEEFRNGMRACIADPECY
ncbi:tetratricopeptide repeat protein [Taklimakanibacter lacteus]|uniref:tetratricopeptide repeat protein n=1 Tax=Taklimakanibacter lacteus TaxID=2268456 RepID=UPI0013C3FE38